MKELSRTDPELDREMVKAMLKGAAEEVKAMTMPRPAPKPENKSTCTHSEDQRCRGCTNRREWRRQVKANGRCKGSFSQRMRVNRKR